MRTITLKPYLAIILTLAWSIACVQAQFTFTHIGTGATGSITPNAEPGSFTLEGGGDDIWDTTDNCDFAHSTITGDFDLRVRVESLEFTATWTKAGLMARESVSDSSSRMAFNRVTPSTGANDSRFSYRTGINGAGGNGGNHEDGSGAPGYPNAWLRLVRSGNVFTAYRSDNGLNWLQQGVQNTAEWLGNTPVTGALEVGLAVSRHSGGDPLATCQFRDYGNPNSTASITRQPASQTIEEAFGATFGFTSVGGLDIYDIQWRKNGVDIAGANGATYSTGPQAVSDSGAAYSVAIRNKLNSSTATSADAILTVVPDVTIPTVVSVGSTPGVATRVNVLFSEPVNEADAENLANYSLPGLTLSAAVLQADNRTVHLTTSTLNTPCVTFALTISGVRDRAGTPNTMASATVGFLYSDGVLRYNEYHNIGGGLVSDLTGNAAFPNSPNVTSFITAFENPNGGGGQGDNYGGRMVGYITPPVTGAYKFFIAADDGAVLYLSTDENPANKVSIATEPRWAGFRAYLVQIDGDGDVNNAGRGPAGAGVNISAPITLQAGCRYYAEALWKEGGGGDHMSVAWQLPDGPVPTGPIPGAYLTPLGAGPIVLASALPGDTTISENQDLNLSINITGGTPTYYVQWYKNGAAIPGATGLSYSIVNAKIPDSGTYHATVLNGYGLATSRSAVVNIIVDTVAPAIVSAQAPAGNGNQFDLLFTEPINEADVETLSKYSLPNVTINSATLQADNKTVRITTSTLYDVGCLNLTVGSIRDRAVPANTFAGGTVPVIAASGGLRYHQFNDIGGVAVANLTGNAKFPNRPDVIRRVTQFENPNGSAFEGANYGAQFLGFVHPPVTGPYTFYLAADDAAGLWLSTDENPANKVLLASEPIWSGFRTYTGPANGGGRNCPGTPSSCNISAPVNLTAGCKYFVEMIYKEGGGGDFGSVAWQLPGGPVPAIGSPPIQAAFLSSYDIPASIPANQPADVTILAGRRVTFSADIKASPPLAIQWYRNGVAIDGANGLSLTIGPVLYPDDNGSTFHVTVSNNLAQVTSRTATLTVLEDTVAPVVVSAGGGTTLDRVTLAYNEIVDPATGGDAFNYTITDAALNTLQVASAAINPDEMSVTLFLDPSTPLLLDTDYTVSASGVADLSGNVMPETGSATFHSVVQGCGGIIFEAYNTSEVGGTAVSILTSDADFPNSPDFVATIPGLDSRLAYPTDVREQYGARMRGVYVPPTSGNWIFYLRSDDASELWFNPNGISPAGKQRVQMEGGCCQAFEALPTAPMSLVGGQPYYIEVLYKEGGGGDYGQVAARLVGSADVLVPIGARDVGQFATPGFSGTISIATQPMDQTVMENRNAGFSVAAVSSLGLPICYQWYRDGAEIPGATGQTLSFRTVLSDNGAVFTVRASIVGNATVSAAATLTVTPDGEGPHVVSATGSDTFRNVTVRFDEPLDPGTAADAFNYTISGGLTVDAAALLPDGMSVRLNTSEQTPGTQYTVTVAGVLDLASTPNVVDEDFDTATFTAFTFNCGLLVFEAFHDIPGNAVSDLVNNPKFPNSPDLTRYMGSFDTIAALGGANYRESFGGRVHGVFVPPASGNYIFYLRSDDGSELYLNPAGIDPAGKVKIQEEPTCCRGFSALPSAPQALVAGQHYYIEGLYKEGGGGDYIQVAAKLDTDLTNPDSLAPIGGGSLGIYAEASGAQIRITENAVSQAICLNPLVAIQPAATFRVAASASPDGPVLRSEDFNAGNGGFTVSTDTPFSGPWVYNAGAGAWQADGQAAELGAPMTSRLNSPTLTVNAAGVVRLTFSHRWSFEAGWDAGQVKVSINGGPYTVVPASAFTENGYNGTVIANSSSAAANQAAFINDSPSHGTGQRVNSTADLATLNAGDTISVQFLYAADTNTRGNVPNWEIDSLTISEGGAPGLPVFVQWQRNNGAGWKDVPGAMSATYTFNPGLADNGARFRALISSPGSSCTLSAEADLSVDQMNTPPRFDLTGSASSAEDDGPQTVAGFASNISPHSIVRVPVVFATAFNNAAGLVLYGTAVVAGGVAQLTTPVNSIYGGLAVDAPAANYESIEVSWKSRIGGGAGGGADGYSLNIGEDLAGDPGYGGEEGKGLGLQVTVDTFNNAELRSPDEGIQIKWRGTEVAFQFIPKDNVGDGNYLRKDMFVDAKLTVNPEGLATLTYDGNTISGQLPTYTGLRASRALFWARTGGANDNHFLDDLDIKAFPFDSSSVEGGQTVAFEVSNNNPALFSQAPAISPDGTLSYATAPNACGEAIVSVVARDNGGTTCNGDDASDAKTFTITVACGNDCPIATPQTLTAFVGVPLAITLTGTDIDGDPLSAAVLAQPQKGTLAVSSGQLTYTAAAGADGVDSFTFTVSDGTCISAAATVTINIVPNNLPVCVAAITPNECGVTFPHNGKLYAIAVKKDYICLVLNGSGSTDADGDPLSISWIIDGTNLVSGTVVTNCLSVGCHTITMIANDGKGTCHQFLDLCVIEPSEAVEQIIALVESTPLERKNKRPLLVSLKAAKAAFDRDGWKVGALMLRVFEYKVQAQIARRNPAEAAMFIQAAENVINAIKCVIKQPRKGDDDGDDDDDRNNDDDDGPNNGHGHNNHGDDDDGRGHGDDDDGGSHGDDDDGGGDDD